MKKVSALLILMMALILCLSCSAGKDAADTAHAENVGATQEETTDAAQGEALLPDVLVSFGQFAEFYTLHMYDNDTAVELYRNITNAGRQLPVYDFDNYEGYEFFQYYDIPSYYNIPAGDQQLIESETAGEVYYSAPNRVILFYQDAEIPMTMTKIGYFDNTEEFRNAVASNEPLEFWGNLLFIIRYAQ